MGKKTCIKKNYLNNCRKDQKNIVFINANILLKQIFIDKICCSIEVTY